ncbi:MAG TPA: WcaI family glycosyltransferase [Methylovirgula sp.]
MDDMAQTSLSIVIVGLNYAPELVGVGRYTGEIGQYLEAKGHNVRVVTAPPHYPAWAVGAPYSPWRYVSERSGDIRLMRCPIVLRRNMRGIWRLIAPLSFAISSAPVVLWTVLRYRPDVVLCVEPTLFAAPMALLAARLISARTVLHVQDLEVDAAFAVGHLRGNFVQKFATWIERVILQKFDQVVSISNKMRKRLISKGVRLERVSLIRNWVDLDRIYPLSGPNGFRTELALADDIFVVLYSGTMGVKQALHLVLDVAERFVKEQRPIVFVIAGDGPEKQRLLARYGGLPNVRFLALQPESRLCELLNLADLHVLPQSEGIADLVLPSKLGGMLASGKPILVTADAGTELFDVLQGAALIVPVGDKDAVARAIIALAEGRSPPLLRNDAKLVGQFSRANCLRQMHSLLAGQ